jgi:hypothetical protein
MNFPPAVKAWLQLISLVLSTGVAIGVTSFLGGSSPLISVLIGVATAGTNVYHAIAASPKDKADAASSAPFPASHNSP